MYTRSDTNSIWEPGELDFPAFAQRVLYPRTHTLDAAWIAAANSGYASAIMGASHLLWVGRMLAGPAPIGPALVQLAFGFVYIVLAVVAFRRSRIASIAVLALVVFEILIEFAFALGLRFNLVILALAFVLAVGGLRGANAVFVHVRNGRAATPPRARR